MGLMFENEAELLAEREAERAKEAAWDAMVKEAESENRRLDWAKDEAVARAKVLERRLPHLKAIAALAGGTVEEDGRLMIKGVNANYILDFKEEYTKVSSWRSRPTGKTSIIVGPYESRTRFPEKKDGTYNYVAIARYLSGWAEGKVAEEACKRALKANEGKAEALRKELGLEKYYGPMKLGTATPKDKPFYVKVEFTTTADEAKVKEIYEALVKLGVIKKGA